MKSSLIAFIVPFLLGAFSTVFGVPLAVTVFIAPVVGAIAAVVIDSEKVTMDEYIAIRRNTLLKGDCHV